MIKTKKKKEVEVWYEDKKMLDSILTKDRYDYLVSGVIILKKAMETSRDLCIDTFHFDPLKCVTIDSII